jgi:hypothetical protein
MKTFILICLAALMAATTAQNVASLQCAQDTDFPACVGGLGLTGIPRIAPRGGFELSGDGRTLVIGSPTTGTNGQGQVYVFRRDSPQAPQWRRIGEIIQAPADLDFLSRSFGNKVAVNYDGTVIAVSAPDAERRAGAVYVFELRTVRLGQRMFWAQRGPRFAGLNSEISSPGSNLGTSLAISRDGSIVAAGTSLRSEQTVYRYSLDRSGNYTTLPIRANFLALKGSFLDGGNMAMSDDGRTLVVSVFQGSSVDELVSGETAVFSFGDAVMVQIIPHSQVVGPRNPGNSGTLPPLGISSNGETIVLSPEPGVIQVHSYTFGKWRQKGQDLRFDLPTEFDYLFDVKVSEDGNRFLLALSQGFSPNVQASNVVLVDFDVNSGRWKLNHISHPQFDLLNQRIALNTDGTEIMVTSSQNPNNVVRFRALNFRGVVTAVRRVARNQRQRTIQRLPVTENARLLIQSLTN